MRGFLSICIFFFVGTADAQKFSGQWTGSFDEKGRPDLKTDYVLEIEAKERSFEGSSITYFVIRGKRYFTICRIKGTIDPLSKTIISTEVERIKANTPPDFKDCFQIHTLTYFKKDTIEQLVGVWKPAKPTAGCGGTGSTLLQRKVFTQKKINSSLQNNIAKKPATKPQEKAPLNSSTSKPSNPLKETEQIIKQQAPVVNAPKKDSASSVAVLPPVSDADKAMKKEIEKRENQRYETITLTSPDIEISLYDNAEVDGDIVTVLFNDVVVVSKQPLSKTPIVRKLRAETGKENLLVMYAENMGRIPPNTAFMRIKNGDQLYKVLLSADEKKNATVVFRITSL
ncbi:MAG: hypothetical protein ACO3BD_04455 [Chitinophagaceae bacterium]